MQLVITALVALVSGAIGAMGYSYYFGASPQASSSSQAKTEARSRDDSSRKGTVGDSGADPANASSAKSIAGSNPGEQTIDLSEQIRGLNRRIDRLSEEVERLHQLLSLAVPLLQRVAPKN
jgi:hypothetical protein